MITSTCQSCDAQVIWCRTETGKRIAVDAGPTSNGNLVLSTDEPLLPTARSVGSAGRKPGQLTYQNHGAVCRDAAKHRRHRAPAVAAQPPARDLLFGGAA